MGLFKKYSYWRAIFIGIPFGIGFLVTGINQFKSIPDSIASLNFKKGEIVQHGYKNKKIGQDSYEVYYLKLRDRSEYYSDIKTRKEKIEYKIITLNKTIKAEIWYDENYKIIEQLIINGEMVIEYKPPYWIAHVFFWVGLILLIAIAIGLYQSTDYKER